MPSFVQTVTITDTCAALIRIPGRSTFQSLVRKQLLLGLSSTIGYCLFDVSYEGAHVELQGNDVPLSDKELQDMEVAAADIGVGVPR